MRRCIIILSAWLCLAGSLAPADQAKPQAPLTLQQCLDIAMKNQTDVITARNNVTIAKGRSAEALSAYLPQLSIQNNAFQWGIQTVLSRTTTGTALNISQNVFDGGLREASNLQARCGVTENRAALSRTIQTVTYTTTTAYYDALRAKHLADVAQATVTYTEELRNQVQKAAEEGTAAKADVLPVEAELANARVSLITAQNNVKTALLALQTTIGLMPQAGFDIEEAQPVANPDIGTLDAYVTKAIAARPDVLQAKAGAGAARASLRSARISLYPRPVISGQYQKGIEGGFTTSGGQVVGGIVFDLFNGGANQAAYREAKASAANAAQQEKQALRDIPAQVEDAYLNLTSSKDRLAASEVGLSAAQVNYDAQKERYAAGTGTILDPLNAQVQLTTAQSNAVQARYDYYSAIAQMDYAVGAQGGSNGK
jgi:outer membrane protein